MLTESGILKSKATNLMLSALIAQIIAVMISVGVLINKKAVKMLYAGYDQELVITVPMALMIIYSMLISLVLFVVFYVLLTQAAEASSVFAIAFTTIHMVLMLVIFPIVSRFFIYKAISGYGVTMIASYSVFNSAVSFLAGPVTTVASALFFICCGLLIAADHVRKADKANQGFEGGYNGQ